MSFSLAVADKDISLRGSQIDIVRGVKKIEQDVSIWLRERYRSDRFHTGYGSTLENFIGSVIEDDTKALVESEIMRVIQNYQSLQYRKLKESPQLLSADEILVEVTSIRTVVDYDSVIVNLSFRTGSKDIGSVAVGLQL